VSFRATEIYFTLAVTYLAVVWVLSGLIRALEARLALPEAKRVRTRRQQRLREAV
jgi:ABC-type amino acid transport system permease subunit